MNVKNMIRRLRHFSLSILGRVVNYKKSDKKDQTVTFVIEDADWAIKRVGDYICQEILKQSSIHIDTTSKPYTNISKIVHFGSQYMWLDWGRYMSKNHHYVVSFFHGKPEDGPEVAQHVQAFLRSVPRLSKIVVSNSIVENRLKNWGVPAHKVVKIPIGVDMDLFTLPNEFQREEARKFYNMPENTIVIGSFQKDGVGWGDGMLPKLIKGPDILLDALKIVNKKVDISMLLTGPARGYVKAGLKEIGIPYTHTYVEEYADLTKCYHALDLCLISSREEGGPMALMEGMSSGVPIVSTPVGMATDFIINGENGAVSEIISPESLADSILHVVDLIKKNTMEKERIRSSIEQCSWPVVAKKHLNYVYSPLFK